MLFFNYFFCSLFLRFGIYFLMLLLFVPNYSFAAISEYTAGMGVLFKTKDDGRKYALFVTSDCRIFSDGKHKKEDGGYDDLKPFEMLNTTGGYSFDSDEKEYKDILKDKVGSKKVGIIEKWFEEQMEREEVYFDIKYGQVCYDGTTLKSQEAKENIRKRAWSGLKELSEETGFGAEKLFCQNCGEMHGCAELKLVKVFPSRDKTGLLKKDDSGTDKPAYHTYFFNLEIEIESVEQLKQFVNGENHLFIQCGEEAQHVDVLKLKEPSALLPRDDAFLLVVVRIDDADHFEEVKYTKDKFDKTCAITGESEIVIVKTKEHMRFLEMDWVKNKKCTELQHQYFEWLDVKMKQPEGCFTGLSYVVPDISSSKYFQLKLQGSEALYDGLRNAVVGFKVCPRSSNSLIWGQ